jgi:ABC-type nitrate/sulfonate/bicarbonate transport system permease component
MIRQPISLPIRVGLGVVSVLVCIAAYAWLSHRQHAINPKDTTIPKASQFADGWKKLLPRDEFPKNVFDKQQRKDYLESSWLLSDFLATYGRLLAGLCVGISLSVIVGVVMGCFTKAAAFFHPPLSFFAKIPPTAMLAVYFVIFGTEAKLFIAMIALGIFPTLAQGIYQAAKKDVTDHAVYKAYTLGASQMEVIWNVVCQQILPRIIENIRLQIGPAMVFLIAAEWLIADVGFGYRLRIQSRLLHMDVVYIYLIFLGVSGFIFDWMLSMARRKLSPWFGE